MSAEPRDGFEAAFLRAFRQLTRREQLAADAAYRLIDGQPIEACMVEMYVDMGETLAEARRRVREVSQAADLDWRAALN
jgi:hypothetical protein